METKTQTPSFTVSLRGYDRMEVDDYLDSLSDALGQVDVARETTGQLQSEIYRLRTRVAELEQRIRTESPKSGAALGERITLILQEAEQAATEMTSRAEADADAMMRSARAEAAEAEDRARAVTARAEAESRASAARSEEQARRVEASARAEAAEIVAEAEARAAARTRQIEQWAEQVIAQTKAEEARMLAEKATRLAEAEADVKSLLDRRDSVAATLADLRRTLGDAISAIGADPAATEAPAVSRSEASDPGPAPELDSRSGSASESGLDQTRIDKPVDSVSEVGGLGDDLTDDANGEADVWAESLDDRDAAGAEMPWPSAFNPFVDDEVTGSMTAIDVTDGGGDDRAAADVDPCEGDNDARFDTRFDTWMTGDNGPRHFKPRF